MLEMIKSILTHVLTALYQPFGFAVLLAILFMFVYLTAEEQGWKVLFRKWCLSFKTINILDVCSIFLFIQE